MHAGTKVADTMTAQSHSLGEAHPVIIGPVITSFQAIQGQDSLWTFSGHVSDSNQGAITVTLGGLPSTQGQTVTVQSNGNFSITIQLQPGENGIATAQATDSLALQSNVAMALVSQN
jgi:hypothetical protein